MTVLEYAQMRDVLLGRLVCGHCSVSFPDDGELSEHLAAHGHHLCHRGITQVAGCWECSDRQYMDTTGRKIGKSPVDWAEELIKYVEVLPGKKPYALTRMESLLSTSELCDAMREYLESLRQLDIAKKMLREMRGKNERSSKLITLWLYGIAAANITVAGYDSFGRPHHMNWASLIAGFVLLCFTTSPWRNRVIRNTSAVTGDRR
jgi:hypothetical protein